MVHRSITLRISLLFATVSTVVLLVLGYYIGNMIEAHFEERDWDELRGKMTLLRHMFSEVALPEHLAEARHRIADLAATHEHLRILITAADGSVLYSPDRSVRVLDLVERNTGLEQVGATTFASWISDELAFRGAFESVATGLAETPRINVGIALNTDHELKFIASFRRRLWLAIFLGLTVAGVLGSVAAVRGLRPVRMMARVTQRVSASDLAARVTVDALPAELIGLATDFNGMLDRLEDSFRRLSEFSSDLAHELRTPIANLLTETQVTLSRPRTTEQYRELLYSNIEELERMARMVSDMLFLAKADNGLMVPSHEEFDVAQTVRELFDFYSALAVERNLGLSLNGEASFAGDRLMIRRAISNLLANAIDHATPGSAISVGIEASQAGPLFLSVRNVGDVIPASHVPRVFDRFHRVDPSRKRSGEGAGLGLAITKTIVAAHHGTINVSSAGGVTEFQIVLPVRKRVETLKTRFARAPARAEERTYATSPTLKAFVRRRFKVTRRRPT